MKRTAVHVQVGSFEIQGLEEGKAHQMIPVRMGEKEIDAAAFFIGQFVAQPADTGAGIHHNNFATFSADFQTGGIAAILQVLFPGYRYRAP